MLTAGPAAPRLDMFLRNTLLAKIFTWIAESPDGLTSADVARRLNRAFAGSAAQQIGLLIGAGLVLAGARDDQGRYPYFPTVYGQGQWALMRDSAGELGWRGAARDVATEITTNSKEAL